MAEVTYQLAQKWGAQGRAAYQRGSEGLTGRAARSAGQSEVNAVLIRRHEQRALILRAEAAKMVEDSIGTESGRWSSARRAQSTGYLAKITGREANSTAGVFEYGVGNARFLDGETARYGRYWRSFEFGFSGHVGNPIRFPGKFRAGSSWMTLKPLPASRGRSREQDPSIRTVEWGPARIKRPITGHGVYAELRQRRGVTLRNDLREDARIFLNGLVTSRQK